MARRWLIVECQPFFAHVDARLVSFLASLRSLVPGTLSSAKNSTARVHPIGIKLFFSDAELVMADSLISSTSIPVRASLRQFFVSTHIENELESNPKGIDILAISTVLHSIILLRLIVSFLFAAHSVVQPSQVYDVTIVGLEAEVPLTKSYILHPFDVRLTITRQLAIGVGPSAVILTRTVLFTSTTLFINALLVLVLLFLSTI